MSATFHAGPQSSQCPGAMPRATSPAGAETEMVQFGTATQAAWHCCSDSPPLPSTRRSATPASAVLL